MKFSPLPCYLVPLRPKYSPQYPILKHPQPTFLPQCQRPSFTPISETCSFKFCYVCSKSSSLWKGTICPLYTGCWNWTMCHHSI
jgi:hypothetical protein